MTGMWLGLDQTQCSCCSWWMSELMKYAMHMAPFCSKAVSMKLVAQLWMCGRGTGSDYHYLIRGLSAFPCVAPLVAPWSL